MNDEYIDLDFAKIDKTRFDNTGIVEAIFAKDKSVNEVVTIAKAMYDNLGYVFATNVNKTKAEKLNEVFCKLSSKAIYDPLSLSYYIKKDSIQFKEEIDFNIKIVTAGTSDSKPAREACAFLEFYGFDFTLISDLGVASINRLFSVIDELRQSDVIIVFAGMDGALPSVIAGLVKSVVILWLGISN